MGLNATNKQNNYTRKFNPIEGETPAVTRKELAYRLQSLHTLDPQLSKVIVNLFFEIIRDSLVQGEDVRLSSFGTFTVVETKERPGLNITTREKVTIPARRAVRFKPSRKIRMVDVTRQQQADQKATTPPKSSEQNKIFEIIRQVQENCGQGQV